MRRFHIRDLLWLTVVIALAVGWSSQNAKLQQDASIWKHRATAAKGMLMRWGWDVSWETDKVQFENGGEITTCPTPQPGKNYVWYKERAGAN